jgi:hypothetical protein
VSLPWVPEPIRNLLLADGTFAAMLQPDRVVFQAPPLAATPWAEILVPGNISLSGDGVAWSPLVQVNACCPPGFDHPNPKKLVWDIAARAAWVLGRARNLSFANMSYSGRHTDGPLPDVDKSRGDSAPILRAIIRAELTARTT